MGEHDKVDSQSIAYKAMAERWDLPDDLLGGTPRMRETGKPWLPMSEGETLDKWGRRRDMSFLFNAYRDTITKIASKPFSKEVVLNGDLPSQLTPIQDDVDRAGRNLTQFGRDVLFESVHRGLTHVLVEFPKGKSSDNQQEVLGIRRPYWIHIPAVDLFAWRGERDRSTGERRLTHIRYHTSDVEPDGEWGEKEVKIIRVVDGPPRDEAGNVIGVGTWRKYRKTERENDGNWRLVESGEHSFPGVPLVTFYAKRTGWMTGEPVLQDLAWLNLRHWQSSSEQNNILHVARVPILFQKGVETIDPDTGKPIKVSIDESVATRNPDADMKWVEPSGAAIESGENDLGKIEERMEILGAQPFMRRTGTMVATGRAIDNAESNSMVKALVSAEELYLRELYAVSEQWLNIVQSNNVRIPEDFGVDIFSEFGLSQRAEKDIDALIRARQMREISRPTFLGEIKARALLSETVDVDEEIERIEAEGPPLGVIGMGDGGDDDEDDGPDADDRQDEQDAEDAGAAA